MYVKNLARKFHRFKPPCLLFKLHIKKAFDSVRWDYIMNLLHHCDVLSPLLFILSINTINHLLGKGTLQGLLHELQWLAPLYVLMTHQFSWTQSRKILQTWP